jgi:hypothetical protein
MNGTMFVFEPGTDINVKRIPLTAPPELKTLQKLVGGYIEVVPHFKTLYGKPCVAYCNEEGKLNGLPINHGATALWAAALGASVKLHDVLAGTVVVLTGDPEILE